jgi:hypothetical protein
MRRRCQQHLIAHDRREKSMQYRLRTLLIVLALGPPLIWAAWVFWPPPAPKSEPLPFQAADVQYFESLLQVENPPPTLNRP